jgi:hypothetical protein
VTSILWPLTEALSSSLLVSTPDPDPSDDYPEIGASACGEPAEGGRLICMGAPNGDRSHNNSSRYPTVGRSEASDAQTPRGGLVRNLNPDINAGPSYYGNHPVHGARWLPLAILAQQGIEAANLVIIEKSASVPRREPSVGDNDRTRHARSEVASAASPNRICPSMMHGGASPSTVPHENMVMIRMTSVTSLKIGGVSVLEHHPHHDGL